MSNTENDAPTKGKWSNLLRRGLWIAGGLAIALVVLFFVVTSSGFITTVVLPKVESVLNARIEVKEISLSPFSQVVVRGLKVQPKGRETLLELDELKVRYSLFAILGGNLQVQECKIVAPRLQVVMNADGTSNLDPLLKSFAPSPPAPSTPTATPSKPLRLSVRDFALPNASVRYVQNLKDGTRQVAELTNVTVTLNQLQNGQAGKLNLAANLSYETGKPAAIVDLVKVTLSGSFDFQLDAQLWPQMVNGGLRFNVPQAQGRLRELQGMTGALDCDVTATEVRQVSLRFERAGAALGRLRLSGPMDLAKTEGRLKLEVSALDRQVLNLPVAAQGWDFDQSTLNLTNVVDLSQKGKIIAANGQLVGRKLGFLKDRQATPKLDLDFEYQCLVNLNDSSALVQKFNLQGRQGSAELLRSSLNRPLMLSWGANLVGLKDATLSLALTNLNLADWTLILGETAPTAKVSLDVQVLAQQDGRQIAADVDLWLRDLSARVGANAAPLRFDAAEVAFKCEVEQFKKANLAISRIALTDRGQSLVTGNGAVNYDLGSTNIRAQLTIEAALPPLAAKYPMPGLKVETGSLKVSGLFTQKEQLQSLGCNVLLAEFTGQFDPYRFDNYQAQIECNVAIQDQSLRINRLGVTTRQGFDPGGVFDMTGVVELAKPTAQLTFNVVDLNQYALRPFLTPFLAPKTLASISLNVQGKANYDPQGDTTLVADVEVANLLVTDPAKQLPVTPLGTRLQVDGSWRHKSPTTQQVELRQFLVSLTPTARATNQLQVLGNLELTAPTNASAVVTGGLTVKAEALDLAPYYEILTGRQPTPTAATSTPAPAPAPATPAATTTIGEPPATELPLRNFAFDLDIGRLYVGEIAITNWQTGVRINRGEVAVNPLQLVLNGAPVKGSVALNLGVPGYTYDVNFLADQVPLEPLATTFDPAWRGQFKGNVLAQLQVKGAGLTGASLQRNLSGQWNLSCTNAAIKLAFLKAPIENYLAQQRQRWGSLGAILLVPLKSLADLDAVRQKLANWCKIPELSETPVDTIDSKATFGGGKIALRQFVARTGMFELQFPGSIVLQPVLTNSPVDFPVAFALRRAWAPYLPSDTPADATLVKYPSIAKIGGTLGQTKYELNLSSVGKAVVKEGLSLVGEKLLGGKSTNAAGNLGGALKNLGGSLLGQPAATNAPPATGTNAPPKPKASDLLKLFDKK